MVYMDFLLILVNHIIFVRKNFLVMVVCNVCYFPVLITPESLSLLFTFLCVTLNLRPKEKL